MSRSSTSLAGKKAALFAIGQGARALVEPDVVLRIDEDAAGLAEDPVVGQRHAPHRVDLEFRRFRECGL